METYNQQELVARIYKSRKQLYTINSLKLILGINNDQTLFSTVKKLIKSKVLEKIEAGKYITVDNPPRDFLVANFLYQPSYVSFEAALNFYGILSQFPYEITSASVNKSKTKIINDKAYSYTHLKRELYWGYEKMDGFLIAQPEKALFDQVYLASKGLRRADFDEYDFSVIKKTLFWKYFDNHKNLKKFARRNLKML